MVTDDPKPAQKKGEGTPASPHHTAPQQGERTTLARLIAESPRGLDVQRVLEWADQLAAAVDDLHARGRCHGSIDPSTVFLDERDEARLGVGARPDPGPTERDLLLGDAGTARTPPAGPARPQDDVRALAATLYEALGGNPDAITAGASQPPPIPGVSVQINMALLAALSPRGGRRVATAGDLVGMLRGAPVPARTSRRTARTWISRVAVVFMAAAAVVCVIAGIRLWVASGPPPSPRDEPVLSGDLLAADMEIKAALEARAQRQAGLSERPGRLWHALPIPGSMTTPYRPCAPRHWCWPRRRKVRPGPGGTRKPRAITSLPPSCWTTRRRFTSRAWRTCWPRRRGRGRKGAWSAR
jgi:hypothetical protein